MNTAKYMVRFYSVHASDGQPRLEPTREVQVHRLINAAILLAGPASALPSGAQLEAAKFSSANAVYTAKSSQAIGSWKPTIWQKSQS